MKGVQTVSVFAFSAVFFCRYEETQVRVLVTRALHTSAAYNSNYFLWQIHLSIGTIRGVAHKLDVPLKTDCTLSPSSALRPKR
jgi:hypothetical protein